MGTPITSFSNRTSGLANLSAGASGLAPDNVWGTVGLGAMAVDSTSEASEAATVASGVPGWAMLGEPVATSVGKDSSMPVIAISGTISATGAAADIAADSPLGLGANNPATSAESSTASTRAAAAAKLAYAH